MMLMDNATPVDMKKFMKKGNLQSGSKFGTTLMGLSVLMVAGSIIYSSTLIVNSSNPINTNSKAAEKINQQILPNDPKLLAAYKKVFDNIPDNPDTVIATASSKGEMITLNSNQPYPYEEVIFSWPIPKTHEPGSKIIAYYVYFGPDHFEIPFPLPGHEKSVTPKNDGVKVTENSYTAKDLVKGQTYYLYIQTQTDSKKTVYSIGMEKLPNFQTLPAKNLFIYKYE